MIDRAFDEAEASYWHSVKRYNDMSRKETKRMGKTAAEFDQDTAASLKLAQRRQELEREYSTLSFENMVDARYELSQSIAESEARVKFLNELIAAYLMNSGDLYLTEKGGFKADVSETYRVSVRNQGRDTLDADLLFKLGVDSAIIEQAKKHSEYVVVEVRKIR